MTLRLQEIDAEQFSRDALGESNSEALILSLLSKLGNERKFDSLRMKKPRRIKTFTIETERTLVFRNFGSPQPGWCAVCGSEVPMATVIQAAIETGLSELAIYQLLDAGAIHFTEDSERHVIVCLDSLSK